MKRGDLLRHLRRHGCYLKREGASHRTGLTPEQPIGQVVLPGDYELQVQIVDERQHWWRSAELPVSVSTNGDLRL